jgi:hypothetical protein
MRQRLEMLAGPAAALEVNLSQPLRGLGPPLARRQKGLRVVRRRTNRGRGYEPLAAKRGPNKIFQRFLTSPAD